MGFSSQAGHVILRKQSVAGTYAADIATAGVGVKLRTGSLGPTRELMIPDAEIGGGRDVVQAYLGAGAFTGDYEFYARMEMLATLLQAALGDADSDPVTGVTGANSHVITPSDEAQLPFYSIEEAVGNGLEVYNYVDAVVNTLHLECDANGYLSGTAGFIAIKQTAGETATDTADILWDNTPMLVGTNVTVKYNSIALPAKSFSLDINNNYEDDDFRLGSFYLGDLTPKRREITCSFGIRHADSDMWRQAVYGVDSATEMGGLVTMKELEIKAETYEKVPGAVDPQVPVPFSLDAVLSNFLFKPFAFAASGDDILENDVEGQAVRPEAETALGTFTLVNGATAVA